jgi:hypothetical protein
VAIVAACHGYQIFASFDFVHRRGLVGLFTLPALAALKGEDRQQNEGDTDNTDRNEFFSHVLSSSS